MCWSDEISFKKGHVIFVASSQGGLETETYHFGGLPDRKKAPVNTFSSGIPQRLRDTIPLRRFRYVLNVL